MESLLKALVILAIVAGILWTISPLVQSAVGGEFKKPADIKIAKFAFSSETIPDTECSYGKCAITVNGTLYNYGSDATNVLMAVYFYDSEGINLGTDTLPLISRVSNKEEVPFSFQVDYSCNAKTVNVAVIHSELA